MKYEILDHTADICIRVFGTNLSELFENAAYALMDLITDSKTVGSSKTIPFDISSDTEEELLVKMLSEILYFHQVEKLVFHDVEIMSISPNRITGNLYGEPFDSSKHELEFDIKAATYHNLNIEKVDDRFITEIVFDI